MTARSRKTTRFTTPVNTIADIVALEGVPYDDAVPSRNLYELFEATALLHPNRPALTVMKSGDPEEAAACLTHQELLGRITQAANLFRALDVTPKSGAVAFLCPALAQIPAALLGAQVAGVASTINYLLDGRRRSRSADRRERRGAGDTVRGGRCGHLAEGERGDRAGAIAAIRPGLRRRKRSGPKHDRLRCGACRTPW